MAQFEEVFFDSRYYPVKSLLYGYGNLDTLAERSLEYVPGQSAGEIYRTAIKTHLDERRQKMIQKLAELEQELQSPMPYTLKVDHQDLYLEFEQRYRRKNQFAGLDGYRYSFNGRTYCDVKSLWKESVEEIAENVQIVTDVYGEKVLKCYTQIPTFDSSDREWDSKEVEFLFFDGKDIHLVIMRGGYKIAHLTFYEKLLSADAAMKPLFKKLGWPESGIRWV